jgi:NAD(P)-dependent dehydrogenase (short-subunit alcohol dehydrogenase family)
MPIDSHGRVAVVTGAASSIGQALAIRLAADGHRVAIADLSVATTTVRLITEAGGEAAGFICDIASGESVAELAASVSERFGACDVLVANAGIYPIARFLDTSWETWRRIMAVNLDSLFHLSQAFLPAMVERGWGRIIATATNGFHTGLPGLTPYVASKGGVIGFVRSLAGEVGADGVTVNAIAPSLTRTDGTTSGPHEELGLFEFTKTLQAIHRTGTPGDLVGAVSFFASDESAFVTGQTLAVDGGLVRS